MNNAFFNINENQITSLKGDISYFYEVLSPDLEMMSFEQQEHLFEMIEKNINNTDEIVKFYKLDHKLYLNSFCEIDLPLAELHSNEKPLEVFNRGIKEQAVVYENYLTLGNDFIRLLSIQELPTNLNLLESLAWPNFVLSFKKIPKLEAKKGIDFKRKINFSSLFEGMRNLDSENAYYQAEEILNDITTDIKALFNCEIFFILKAHTKAQLDEITDQTIYEFKGKGAALRVEQKGLAYFYEALVPGVATGFKRGIETPSDYLSYLIPLHRNFVMDKGIELNSRSFEPIFFDLYDPYAMNYNLLITGSSGQGKSMIANKLLAYEISKGTKGVVLDLGNSFLKNAKFHDGNILSQKINPLQFENPRYLKEFILSAIDGHEKFSKKDEGRLFTAIEELLKEEKFANFNDLVLKLEKEFEGLSYYFKEIEEYFTDKDEKLCDFSYCDFSNYPEAMKAPLIIYLIEYFKNLSGKKIFIFDECWHLLNKNAEYIADCFRTFRKYQASAIAISQNMDDFLETQLGRVIVQNTYYKFFFKQSLKESEFLDTHAKELLDSIFSVKGEYSEFLLLSENIKKPVRYISDLLEYEIFTSDRDDNKKFQAYFDEKGRFLSFKEAMVNFTTIKNPTWRQNEIIF